MREEFIRITISLPRGLHTWLRKKTYLGDARSIAETIRRLLEAAKQREENEQVKIVYDHWYGELTRYLIGQTEDRWFFGWTNRAENVENILAIPEKVSTPDRGISWYDTLAEAVEAARECFQTAQEASDDPLWQELIEALPQ